MRRAIFYVLILLLVSSKAISKPLKEKKVWKTANALLAQNKVREATTFMRKHYDAVIVRKSEFNIMLGEQYGKIHLIDSALYFVNIEASHIDPKINDLAQKQLSYLIPLKEAYRIELAIGKNALSMGELNVAMNAFQKANQIDSGNYEADFYLGRTLTASGDVNRGLIRYFKCIHKFASNPSFKGHVLEHISESYLLKSDYDTAIIFADSALRIDRQVYDAYLWKGEAYYFLREFSEGAKAFETYFGFDKNNAKAFAIAGHCYYEQKRYSSAILKYNKSLEIDSIQAEVLSYKAKSHALIRQFNKSFETFEYLNGLHKGNFYAINGMGVCAFFMKDYSNALIYYKEANDLVNNMWFKYNLALCYQELGQYNNALEMYKQVNAMQKWLPEVIVKKTECYLLAKQYKKLIAYSDEVIEVADKFPFIKEVYEYRADAFKAMGDEKRYQKNIRVATYVKGKMEVNTYPRIE